MLGKRNIQTQQKLVIIIIYYCINVRFVHFFQLSCWVYSIIVRCADQFCPLGGTRQQKCARRVENVPWRRRTIATLRCCHSVYFQGSIHSRSVVFVSHSRAKVLFSLLSVFPLDFSFFLEGPLEEIRKRPDVVEGGVFTSPPHILPRFFLLAVCKESSFLRFQETWAFFCKLSACSKCYFLPGIVCFDNV